MLALTLWFLVRLLAGTWRVRRPPWPVPGPCVVALWHGDQLPMIVLHRDTGMVAMASHSRDGDIVAGVLRRFGYGVVRGSSSRGGPEALMGCLMALREGGRPALAVDGPRGPAGKVKRGAEHLAVAEGLPVVFGRVRAKGWRAGSWDRFLVPWPFARVEIEYGVWTPGEGTLAGAMAALPPLDGRSASGG